MNLLDLIVKEFISLVDKLSTDETIENDRIIIEKERFKSLLEKYAFMNFKQKTQVYKNLNFIIHDKNNYTMPTRIGKKTERKVVINYKAYLTLKELHEQEVK